MLRSSFKKALGDELERRGRSRRIDEREANALEGLDWAFAEAVGADVDRVNEAADVLVRWRPAIRPMSPDSTEAVHLNARADALAAWATRYASESIAVKRWRRTHLRDELLAPGDVKGWVEGRLSAAGGGSLLRWASPAGDGRWETAEWSVPKRSALGDLAEIADKLAALYRCIPASATLFVLTGEPLAVRVLTAGASVKHHSVRGLPSTDAFTTITITIDPAVSGDALKTWWQEIQGKFLPATATRYKPQGEKHARLAEFMAARTEATTYAEDRSDWNALHPDWAYGPSDGFKAEADRAVTKLLWSGWSI